MKLSGDTTVIERKPRRRLMPSFVPAVLTLFLITFLCLGVSSVFGEGVAVRKFIRLLVILGFLFFTMRFLIREWSANERICANVLDVTIEQRIFGKVLGRKIYSVILMSPLSYREWIVEQYDGAGYKESGICFIYSGDEITFAHGVTELQGWEIVDKLCAATGLRSTEQHLPSPALVNFLPPSGSSSSGGS